MKNIWKISVPVDGIVIENVEDATADELLMTVREFTTPTGNYWIFALPVEMKVTIPTG